MRPCVPTSTFCAVVASPPEFAGECPRSITVRLDQLAIRCVGDTSPEREVRVAQEIDDVSSHSPLQAAIDEY